MGESPDAWLINYTNPEAKLVEAVCKLTKIHAVGVCHGFDMGVAQIAKMLERKQEELDITGYGLNHFGWITAINERKTGKDLYPEFRAKESESHWLANWDEVGLSRMMMRTYGLYPYPGTNHIGEYIAWSDEFLASTKIQYFFDPVREKPWETRKAPRFVYDFCSNPTGIAFSDVDKDKDEEYKECFVIGEHGLTKSSEYGIPIIEAIAFDRNSYIPSLNQLNKGQLPGIKEGMCVEGKRKYCRNCTGKSTGHSPKPAYRYMVEDLLKDRVNTRRLTFVKLDDWIGLSVRDDHYIGFHADAKDAEAECRRLNGK